MAVSIRSNVLHNPNVALIFVIPGVTYTLRVGGKAVIVRDSDLRASMAVNRKEPDHVLVVGVTNVYSHCPKCMIRSGLWELQRWPDTSNLPSFAETLVAHAKLNEPVETVAAVLEAGNRERLY